MFGRLKQSVGSRVAVAYAAFKVPRVYKFVQDTEKKLFVFSELGMDCVCSVVDEKGVIGGHASGTD